LRPSDRLGFGVSPTGVHNDGCFLAVFNVEMFRPVAKFKGEVAEFARYLKDTKPAKGSKGVFYPGELEHLTESERAQNGIAVEPKTWNRFVDIATEYGIAERLKLERTN